MGFRGSKSQDATTSSFAIAVPSPPEPGFASDASLTGCRAGQQVGGCPPENERAPTSGWLQSTNHSKPPPPKAAEPNSCSRAGAPGQTSLALAHGAWLRRAGSVAAPHVHHRHRKQDAPLRRRESRCQHGGPIS